jgi:hypothetical protein
VLLPQFDSQLVSETVIQEPVRGSFVYSRAHFVRPAVPIAVDAHYRGKFVVDDLGLRMNAGMGLKASVKLFCPGGVQIVKVENAR